MTSTSFEHYLLILRRSYTSGTWYIALTLVQPTDITRTQYTKFRLCSASWGWASNARNMKRPLIHNKLHRKCITLVSLYWCTMKHGKQKIKCKNNRYFTCHTQYTWERSICIFLFNRTTLQVCYIPYKCSIMCTLCDSTNIKARSKASSKASSAHSAI
jgi:hypothetical protein